MLGPKLPRLRADQWDVVNDEAVEKYIATGRRWGKTTTGLVVAVAGAWAGSRIAWVVPTFRNSNPFWRAAVNSVRHLLPCKLVVINRADRTIEFPLTGGGIAIYSDENIDAVRGEAFHVVLIDEAARIREDSASEVIVPTLADYGGTMFAFSTPRGRNWFYDGWMRGYEARASGDRTVRNWKAATTANPNPMIRRAAVLAKNRVPTRVYQQEWEAEFISSALDIWLREWFEGQQRWVESDHRQYNIAGRYLSFDTGLKDRDDSAYSACAVGELLQDYNLHLRSVWRDRLSFPPLVQQIIDLSQEWNYDGKLCAVVIEDKASGTSAYQTLRQAGPDWLRPLLVPFMPKESKEQRGEQAAVWGKNGVVWLPEPSEKTPWLPTFEREIFKFPDSEYKDQADSFHQLILFLENYLAIASHARGNALSAKEEEAA